MPNPVATCETSLGTFQVELFLDLMPATAGNWLQYAESGFYDGLHFHRVIDGFMVQFGCPYSRDPASPHAGTGDGPRGPIADEFPPNARLSNVRGSLSMANAGPNTGSCQFFVNLVHNAFLDWFSGGESRHPVFGRVIGGMEVVDRIARTPTDADDRPRTPVRMLRITVRR